MIYLDTHVLVWLYAYGRGGVPEAVATRMETTDRLLISPMVRLELEYLKEIGRVDEPPITVLDALETVIGLKVCNASFHAVVGEAESQNWTRDPFHRLIVAHAALFNAQLITKDDTIRANYLHAYWDES